MFTASHNPAQYNGIKMCRTNASPIGLESGLAEIRDRALADAPGAEHRRAGRSRSTTSSTPTPPTCSRSPRSRAAA